MSDEIIKPRKKRMSPNAHVYKIRSRQSSVVLPKSTGKWIVVKVGPSARIYMKEVDSKIMREMPKSTDLFFERSILDTFRNMLRIRKNNEIINT